MFGNHTNDRIVRLHLRYQSCHIILCPVVIFILLHSYSRCELWSQQECCNIIHVKINRRKILRKFVLGKTGRRLDFFSFSDDDS